LVKDGKSGADGVASFDDLVPGKYKAIADKEGFTAADADLEVTSGGSAATTLKLGAGVFDLSVLVQDKAKQPLVGAQVSIDAQGASPATSDGKGIAAFPKIARGTYNV